MRLRSTDVIIAVMGCSGSGKSTFINFFANDHLPINYGLNTSQWYALAIRVSLV